MKILCTGDLHLGRRSTKVPEEQAHLHSACAAWSRIVDLAIDRRVDCVALTGDVIDKDGSYIQAYGPLDNGIRKLSQQGIRAVAVAGNHDYRTLPRFVGSSDCGLKLLGANGEWEDERVNGMHLLGISFTDQYQNQSPLTSCKPGSTACVVLMHADLDVPGSVYCPVSLPDLRKLAVRAVLLGHVHKPRLVDEGTGSLVLNPGSPQAFDPGETGTRGAWIVDVSEAKVTAEQVPLSSVEYRNEVLDVSQAGDEKQLDDLCRALLADIEADASYGCLELVSLRLALIGRTSVSGCLKKVAQTAEAARAAGCRVSVESIEDRTRPPFDVGALASGSDPPGLLARMLLELEQGEDTHTLSGLLDTVSESLSRRGRQYKELKQQEPTGEQVKQMLLRQGYRLLEDLVRQQEDSRER